MPPAGRMASMPCRIVGRSLVGPVTAPTPIENGAMIMRSSGDRYFESVAAVRWTKSIRRDMLELLSTINANVAPTASCLTMSSFCGTSFSSDGELRWRDALEEAPGLVLNRGLDEDAVHFRRFGDLERLENDLVLRFVPERVGDFHRDLAALERIVVDPLGRVGRALRDRAEQLRIDVEAHLPWQDVLRMLDLRDDPHGSWQAGAAERRRDANAERGFLARDWARGSAEREKRGQEQLPASSSRERANARFQRQTSGSNALHGRHGLSHGSGC